MLTDIEEKVRDLQAVFERQHAPRVFFCFPDGVIVPQFVISITPEKKLISKSTAAGDWPYNPRPVQDAHTEAKKAETRYFKTSYDALSPRGHHTFFEVSNSPAKNK